MTECNAAAFLAFQATRPLLPCKYDEDFVCVCERASRCVSDFGLLISSMSSALGMLQQPTAVPT